MTCPVVRVTKMGEGEVEVGKELKEEDEGVGVVANLQVELAEIEEVMPTLEDQQQVSRGVDATRPSSLPTQIYRTGGRCH